MPKDNATHTLSKHPRHPVRCYITDLKRLTFGACNLSNYLSAVRPGVLLLFIHPADSHTGAVNNKFNYFRTALWAFAATVLICQTAAASTIDATGVDSTRGEYGVWITADGADMNTYFAGVISIQLNNGSTSVNRDTLCVDLFTDIYLGQTYATNVLVPSDMPGKNLEWVSWLVDNALLPTQNNTYASALPQSDWVTDPSQGAGIQLAIWDIVEDGGDGFSSGRVQQGSVANPTDPQVLYWAKTYEALSVGHTSNDAFVYLNVNVGNGQPAQMLEGPEFYKDGGPQPAPECSTLLIVGSALVAIGSIRRRGLARQSFMS